MKAIFTIVIACFAFSSVFSQYLISDFQHVSAGDPVTFSWNGVLSGYSIDFDDGTAKYYVQSTNGSVSHTYKRSSVYYVKITNLANGKLLQSITIQVSNCEMQMHDVGTSGDFNLNYCDLVSKGYCNTLTSSKNTYEYWSTQSLIRCFPMNADSCVLEMRCKLSRLPDHYLCLDVGLFIFGSNDVGLVHFFDNASCVEYYSFGVGSDKELSKVNILKMLKNLDGEWITVKLKKEGTKLSSYFDGTLTAEYYTDVSLGQLWGINFVSKGRTQFDFIRLAKVNGDIFYEENYDNCNNIIAKSRSSFPFVVKVDSSETTIICHDTTNYIAVSVEGPKSCHKFTLDDKLAQDIGLFNGMQAGLHNIKIADESNCQALNIPFVVSEASKVNHYEKKFTICEGDTIEHNGKYYSEVGIFYDTIRSQTNCDSVINTLQLIKSNSCDSVYCDVRIPNVFTPNGDQINDDFGPIATNAGPFEISIFDRWGNMVFYEVSLAPKWNGEQDGVALISDIYTYIISGLCSNGRRYSNKGEVLLLR